METLLLLKLRAAIVLTPSLIVEICKAKIWVSSHCSPKKSIIISPLPPFPSINPRPA